MKTTKKVIVTFYVQRYKLAIMSCKVRIVR